MTVTDADRLANEPVLLRLADGRSVSLHYGFGGLRRIEQRMRSVKHLIECLNDPLGDSFYEAVFVAIWSGLWQTGITEDELEALIDPAQQNDYGPALDQALMQAFPQQVQEMAAAAKAEQDGPAETVSPGPTPITQQPSASVVRMTSSGA